MSKTLVLSIHQLVDFLLRSGDIDTRVFNRSSMQEGTRLHSVYQSKQNSETYLSEYPLSTSLLVDDTEVIIQGRADGIIVSKKRYIIDEIKTTVEDLEIFHEKQNEWHLGQAKCYAYMFAKEKHLESIGVRLTYIRQGLEKETRRYDYTYLMSELEEFVINLIADYIDFYQIVSRHLENRSSSIHNLSFPFSHYRKGQKELLDLVYQSTISGGRLFVEAPTGIGKTMSTLFPYIKTIENDDQGKIFYLTAKSSGKQAAMTAIQILKEHNLEINEISITAKDKICFSKGKACNPDECPFTVNYYNKMRAVLRYALLNYSTFDYPTIVDIAFENQMCPFEFQLDLSLFCDLIVCDYNYMFDPISYLRRYLDSDSAHYLALVDEAHNLVNRSREMYSASLSNITYLTAKKSISGTKDKTLKRLFKKIGNIFDELGENEEEVTIFHELPSFIEDGKLKAIYNSFQDISKNDHQLITKEITNLLLEINSFNRICDFFDSRFICYMTHIENEITLRIFCCDASEFLHSITDELKATTFFSATMSPMKYYIDTLGGNSRDDTQLKLPSPFPSNNLLVIIAKNVSTVYAKRDSTYAEVARYIRSFISAKEGNYFIYAPSYEYLNRLLEEISVPNDASIYVQTKDMNEQEKMAFLDNFQVNPSHTCLGFLVIGGAFGEGIDLVSDRLIGAIIIGVGLARLNFESDQIRKLFDEQELDGYAYAYLFPGMNKVMQALGRVIRSENDKGAVLLIDHRYNYPQYRNLFPSEWKTPKIAYKAEDVQEYVSNFFRK